MKKIIILIILEHDFYNNINTIYNPTTYDFLINKNNKLTKDYIPTDLEIIDINYSCKDAFKEGKLDGNQFIIETDDFWGSCYDIEDSTHANKTVYTYENVNKAYKELFGEKQDLPKQLVSFYTYRYAYSEKYDAYVDKAIEKDDSLEIFVNYIKFEYDENNKKVYVSKKYDINVDSEDEFGVNEKELEKLYDRAIKELNEEQITKYKFTFKKSNTGYYLESIVNEVY